MRGRLRKCALGNHALMRAGTRARACGTSTQHYSPQELASLNYDGIRHLLLVFKARAWRATRPRCAESSCNITVAAGVLEHKWSVFPEFGTVPEGSMTYGPHNCYINPQIW